MEVDESQETVIETKSTVQAIKKEVPTKTNKKRSLNDVIDGKKRVAIVTFVLLIV